MKNPLNKRYFREIKSEFGKYLVIFLLLLLTIGFVSGFLVADGSVSKIYKESFEKYNIEDGYFDVREKLTDSQKETIEKSDVTIFENFYHEVSLDNDTVLRIFKDRTDVDKVCLMEGELPAKTGEAAIDRMYAVNNNIEVGDTVQTDDREWKVVGLIALSDYSALFSNNNDSMFDAVKFGVAVVTEDEFASFPEEELIYRYSWIYDEKPSTVEEEKDESENLMYDIGKQAVLDNFVPQYQNQAIQYTGDDMGSDKSMMLALLYIVIAILAFVFAVTTSNTITREAKTIGTLRASGYTKNELLRHYILLPLLVSLAGEVVGNIFGYTVFEDVIKAEYYNSYSLTTYETQWSLEAFILTTIIPFIIMLIINILILKSKLSLSPLNFIRNDLRRRKKGKAMKLSPGIRFFTRFRIRIVAQNIGNYVVLFVGILFANVLLLFGLAFPLILDHYQSEIESNILSDYQYILQIPVSALSNDDELESALEMAEYAEGIQTENEDAEKFTAYTLSTLGDAYDSEDILLYGIEENSEYIPIDFKDDGVYISRGYAEKYELKQGDTITLKEKYENTRYTFKVAGIYDYMGALSVFMDQKQLNETLDLSEEYFSGYFSSSEITDIDENYVASVIDIDDLTKITRQLDISLGGMMGMVDAFSVVVFVVIIYLLAKLIIEKNAQSISMTKILGYRNGEIGKLYISTTTIVVILSILISMPIDYAIVKVVFREVMLSGMSGWISFYVNASVFVKMFLLGIVTYAVVAVFERHKISKIPMEEALKNIE